jgi:lysophospholipase
MKSRPGLFKRVLAIGVFALSNLAAAPSAQAVSEAQLDQEMKASVLPFFWQKCLPGTLPGIQGVDLAFRACIHPQAKATVVFVHGFKENMLVNAETLYDLYQAGNTVIAFDLRGHGWSGRMLADPEIAHVENFSDYVVDLRKIMKFIVQPIQWFQGQKPLFFVAQSTGGGIVARYLELFPGEVTGAVLTSPLIEVNTYHVPATWLLSYAKMVVGKGHGDGYVFGALPITGPYKEGEFNNGGTPTQNSRARFERNVQTYRDYQELRLGGPSWSWAMSALEGTQKIRENAVEIKDPILILQAEKDVLTLNRAQTQLCKKAQDCQLKKIPKSKHSLWQEQDSVRIPVLKATLQFIWDRS